MKSFIRIFWRKQIYKKIVKNYFLYKLLIISNFLHFLSISNESTYDEWRTFYSV